jgi:hypothetical protein
MEFEPSAAHRYSCSEILLRPRWELLVGEEYPLSRQHLIVLCSCCHPLDGCQDYRAAVWTSELGNLPAG